MKKISFLLLTILLTVPAIAEDYDDYSDYYDDTEYTTTTTAKKSSRDTYAGLRIHRNNNIAFEYDVRNGNDETLHNDNFGFGLNIGNRLTENVKLEFETMFTGSSLKEDDIKGKYGVWSNMLNTYLYKTYGGAVEPYLGMGIGFSTIWGDVTTLDKKYNDTDVDLSFAFMTGINFVLNDYVDLNFGFRYVNYGRVKHSNAATHVDATEIYIGGAYKFSIFDK